MPEVKPIDALAAEYQLQVLALQALLDDLMQRSGASAFYIFWNTTAAGGSAPPPSTKPRTLVAFASPDAALAFAQRNRMADAGRPPRLRRLTLVQLIRALLREPAIEALLLADPEQDSVLGQLPPGIVLPQHELRHRLNIV